VRMRRLINPEWKRFVTMGIAPVYGLRRSRAV
jgi:hypothetical protein